MAVALCNLQCIKLINVLYRKSVSRLRTPKELEVRRQNLLCGSRIDNLVHGSSVAHVGITNNAERTLWRELQNCEKRICLLCLCHLCALRACSSLGSAVLVGVDLELCRRSLLGNLSLLGSVVLLLSGSGVFLHLAAVSHCLVELAQVRSDFLAVVCLPEFKVCTTLEELAHTLRLTNTRHFHHDAAFLAFELLDVRLYDTKLVDTVANDVV